MEIKARCKIAKQRPALSLQISIFSKYKSEVLGDRESRPLNTAIFSFFFNCHNLKNTKKCTLHFSENYFSKITETASKKWALRSVNT